MKKIIISAMSVLLGVSIFAYHPIMAMENLIIENSVFHVTAERPSGESDSRFVRVKVMG